MEAPMEARDAVEVKEQAPKIDSRILAAVERNRQYLGLTEWLEQYQSTIGKSAAMPVDKTAH